MNREILVAAYKAAVNYYGVMSRTWSELHCSYSSFAFCKENRKSFISEYLFWEEFTKEMKDNNMIYYQGIDEFLEVYHDTIYSCLNKVEREDEPQYIAYLWNPHSLDRHVLKSRDGETLKSFKERIVKCYPDWNYEISEFNPIYD